MLDAWHTVPPRTGQLPVAAVGAANIANFLARTPNTLEQMQNNTTQGWLRVADA